MTLNEYAQLYGSLVQHCCRNGIGETEAVKAGQIAHGLEHAFWNPWSREEGRALAKAFRSINVFYLQNTSDRDHRIAADDAAAFLLDSQLA